jgi:hypothetical protein
MDAEMLEELARKTDSDFKRKFYLAFAQWTREHDAQLAICYELGHDWKEGTREVDPVRFHFRRCQRCQALPPTIQASPRSQNST